MAFRFITGNVHPDHDTLAAFRRTFLPELKDLFVQVLLLAQEAGVLKLGTISLDGTKVHADTSKRKAVSYKRLVELEAQLRTEVEELFALSEQSEQPEEQHLDELPGVILQRKAIGESVHYCLASNLEQTRAQLFELLEEPTRRFQMRLVLRSSLVLS